MTKRNDGYASNAAAVTPSDTAITNYVGLYVGGAGDVTVKGEGGTAVTFKAAPLGTQIEMHIIAVMATGTTATNLVGFIA